MKRITSIEELTDEVVDREIATLLRRASAHVANRKAQLVLGADFEARDDALRDGPIAGKMRRVFAYVTQDADGDHMAMAELCEEILEFLWSSMFAGHYQIPDSFWETPLGFAIYEVIGRPPSLADDKELTSTQAAKYLGVSQPGLQRLAEDGKVPVLRRVGIHARYRVADLRSAKGRLARSG